MSCSKFATPFRALLWKEWRESWGLLLSAFAPVVLYSSEQLLLEFGNPNYRWIPVGDLYGMLPMTIAFVSALSLGARLFSSERANGTDRFQAERSVTRATIWNAKLFLPALALITGTILLWVAFVWIWPGPYDSDNLWGGEPLFGPEILYMFFAPILLAFTSALFCSVFLDRPVTAWAGGAVVSIFLWLGPLLPLQWLGVARGKPGYTFYMVLLFTFLLVVEPVCLLWLSRVAYVRWLRE